MWLQKQLLWNISVSKNFEKHHSHLHTFTSVLCPDALLFPHVWRRHRDPQRVQEEQRTFSSPPEPDRRSGQLLAEERDPAELHRGLSGHVWGQSGPKCKGWHLSGWHHFLSGVSARLLSWSRGQHSSASCRYTLYFVSLVLCVNPTFYPTPLWTQNNVKKCYWNFSCCYFQRLISLVLLWGLTSITLYLNLIYYNLTLSLNCLSKCFPF